jgi:3-deoxy-D-manno-octulosonic-acid transferase
VVAELLKGLGFRIAQRSQGELPSSATDIYLADTIGELALFYGLAPLAFVGGSLADRGGQNPIEPIRHGAIVLTGPNVHNFRDAYVTLKRHKGAIEVRDAEEMAREALQLFKDSEMRRSATRGAETALATLGGALQRTVEALQPYLPPPPELRRAS